MEFNSGLKGLIQHLLLSLCVSGRTATNTEWLYQMLY